MITSKRENLNQFSNRKENETRKISPNEAHSNTFETVINQNYASKNPFFDDDEDIDDQPFFQKMNYSFVSEEDHTKEKTRQWLLEKQMKEEEIWQSIVRSILETEQIGIAVAEDLIRQGELLERAELKQLDAMEEHLKTSKKHTKAINSVFGCLINHFKTSSNPKKKNKERMPSNTERDFNRNVGDVRQYSLHSQSYTCHPDSSVKEQERKLRNKPLSFDERVIEYNQVIHATLCRLECLLNGLCRIFESQKRRIERLQTATDKVVFRIRSQNEDTGKILKKFQDRVGSMNKNYTNK